MRLSKTDLIRLVENETRSALSDTPPKKQINENARKYFDIFERWTGDIERIASEAMRLEGAERQYVISMLDNIVRLAQQKNEELKNTNGQR